MFFLLEGDGVDAGGTQRTLYKERGVVGEVDHIDILVAQLTDDTVDTEPLHPHAGTYRIDAVVIGLYGYLRALTRDAGNTLDGDQPIGNLGDLLFEEPLQKHRRGAGEDDPRIVVLVLHTGYHCTGMLSLAEEIAGYLFGLGQDQLIVLIVEQQQLLFPDLIDLSRDDLTHFLLVLVVKVVFLQLQDLRCQCLAQVEDGTASEMFK